jgi:hypothetical protein
MPIRHHMEMEAFVPALHVACISAMVVDIIVEF